MRCAHHECFTYASDVPGNYSLWFVLVWSTRNRTAVYFSESVLAVEHATPLAGQRVQRTVTGFAFLGVGPKPVGAAADGALLLCVQSVVGGMGVARWFQF